jgi:RHS repeat-associated protein
MHWRRNWIKAKRMPRSEDAMPDPIYNLILAAATAATPSYDADGNLLSDGVRSYEWNRLSRLVKITWGGSPVKSTEYRYNALGQRSEQIEKSGTTETARFYYLYEGEDLLCRYTGGTAVANIDRRYMSQGEQRKNGSAWSSYYYSRDHLGSVREVMNSNGTLAARYDFDPYGKRSVQYEASGYVCDLGYTGHITQESGVGGQGEIVLTLFRAYDPQLGRWLSADPIGEVGGMNLYAYVNGNPLNYVDLTGENPSRARAILAAIIGLIGGATDEDPSSLLKGNRRPPPTTSQTACPTKKGKGGGSGGKGKGKLKGLAALGSLGALSQLNDAQAKEFATEAAAYLNGNDDSLGHAMIIAGEFSAAAASALELSLMEARQEYDEMRESSQSDCP